jgi:hypothetical protein
MQQHLPASATQGPALVTPATAPPVMMQMLTVHLSQVGPLLTLMVAKMRLGMQMVLDLRQL